MSALDIAGAIGDILTWIGLLLGIPCILTAALVHAIDGKRVPAALTVVGNADDTVTALWTFEQRTYSRAMKRHESLDEYASIPPIGFVSVRDPQEMRLTRRHPLGTACLILGIIMLSAAVVGTAASLLPILL